MLLKKVKISSKNIPTKIRFKKNLIVKGQSLVFTNNNIDFDVKYNGSPKNILITSTIKAKMDSGDKEIRFYFRYQNNKKYCLFTIKNGMWVQFSVINNGEPTLQTSLLKITNDNLFNHKYNLILSIFEETTTVFIDNQIVLNINDTPEIEGDVGIQFVCPKDKNFNLEYGELEWNDSYLQNL